MLVDGTVRWIRTTGLVTRDGQGKPRRYTGSVSDITERKAAEVALRDSEQRFSLVVAGCTDGIWDWNIVTTRCSFEQAQRLYGLAPEAVIRRRADGAR